LFECYILLYFDCCNPALLQLLLNKCMKSNKTHKTNVSKHPYTEGCKYFFLRPVPKKIFAPSYNPSGSSCLKLQRGYAASKNFPLLPHVDGDHDSSLILLFTFSFFLLKRELARQQLYYNQHGKETLKMLDEKLMKPPFRNARCP